MSQKIHLSSGATGAIGAAAAAPPVSSAPQPRDDAEPWPVAALWLLAGLLTWWSFGFTTMMGSDLWWHLAAGRWIWQTGTLNFRDPWSFTAQGQPWLNPEWLSDLIFHAWSSWLGLTSLVWWKWSALVGAFAILFGVLRRLSGSSPAAYVATLFAVAVGAPFFDVRPQLYAILGLAVVLRLALLPSRWRWLLPLVFFLWANLHSSFIFGLVALAGILVIARLCGQGTRNALPLWLACLVVGLLNPAGPDAYLFPVGFAAHSASAFTHIAEWRPPWYPGGIRSPLYYPALGTFALGVAATFSTKLHRRNGHLTFTGVALGLLTLAMSLRSRRFIPLFGVAQALVMAPVLGALAARLAQRARGHFPRFAHPYPWRLLAPALALALAAYHLLPYPLSSRAFLYLTSQDSFPVEAMNVIEANHLTGKVFAYYEWGGYLDLRSDGRLQVYIDGRAGTVFDELTYRDYTRVLGLTKGWEDIVTASGAEFFLWPRRHHQQVEALRASGQWRLIYADHVATLLARADLPVPSPLLPSPASAWRELALGWAASGAHKLPAAEQHFERALTMMPNLRAACEWLANVQARSAHMSQAEATLDRCQRSFPNPSRRQELLAWFRSRAEAPP